MLHHTFCAGRRVTRLSALFLAVALATLASAQTKPLAPPAGVPTKDEFS